MLRLGEGFTGERSIVLPTMVRNIAESDPFLRQLYITDMGYYPHATYHYRERTKPVEQYILIYCAKGSGWYKVRNRRYEIGENQFFVIPAHEPHLYASNNSDPWTIYWVHFTGTEAAFFGEDCYEPHNITPGNDSRIKDRNVIFEEIFLTLSDSYDMDNLRYSSILLYNYLATFRFLHLFRKYHKKDERMSESNMVSASIQYMMENIEKKLSLREMADYAGYSVSQFSLVFKNNTGHSPLNYLNMVKIKQACELLETTDMKINQICGKIGIDDCYYFSRLFKKIVGIAPKQYRLSTHGNGDMER
ncbi:MAG: AraC family transcriptional regulator [Prevotella sp.]|nr:AraC family transcriptional regulator [Prevotella sp.]